MTLSELQSTVIPFGKYKGQTFDDADLQYLDWLIGQDWLQEKFVTIHARLQEYLNTPAIKRELEIM